MHLIVNLNEGSVITERKGLLTVKLNSELNGYKEPILVNGYISTSAHY